MARILLVEPDADLRTRQAVALSGAGHRVTGTGTFETAWQALSADMPDVLVAAVRLGAYNGLHLVIRARASNANVAGIVTSRTADPALEVEARTHGALVLPDASDIPALVGLIGSVRTS
jgi:DNA-binding response OmpR family regulator